MSWVLSEAAVVDLDEMAAQGALRYGFRQSERYEIELVNMLDSLAEHPYMAVERQASASTIRLMPCGVHNIVYVVENEDVIVLRVLHHLQNWFDLL